MSNLEALQHELMVTKARAFDVYCEMDTLKHRYQQQQHILCILAHKLGVTDMNSLSIDALPAMLDDKLRTLQELEQQKNEKD